MIAKLLEHLQMSGRLNENYLSPKIKTLIQNLTQLEKEAGSLFTDLFEPFDHPKGHFLLKIGEVPTCFWLLTSGRARRYYMMDIEEITINYYSPFEFADNYFCSTFGEPSDVNIVLEQPSTGFSINWEKLEALKTQFPGMHKIEKQIVACDMRKKEFHERRCLTLDATDHFGYFMEHCPKLIEDTSDKHLAQFIGVDRATLCRSKNKWLKKK
jgi:hypothetical protein